MKEEISVLEIHVKRITEQLAEIRDWFKDDETAARRFNEWKAEKQKAVKNEH